MLFRTISFLIIYLLCYPALVLSSPGNTSSQVVSISLLIPEQTRIHPVAEQGGQMISTCSRSYSAENFPFDVLVVNSGAFLPVSVLKPEHSRDRFPFSGEAILFNNCQRRVGYLVPESQTPFQASRESVFILIPSSVKG